MSYADRVERIQPSLTLKINAEAAAIQADHRGGDAVARLGAGEELTEGAGDDATASSQKLLPGDGRLPPSEGV